MLMYMRDFFAGYISHESRVPHGAVVSSHPCNVSLDKANSEDAPGMDSTLCITLFLPWTYRTQAGSLGADLC